MAAALTAYDKEEQIVEEERYGELTIEQFRWGNDEDPSEVGSLSEGIDFHFCSEEELGLKKGESESQVFELPEGAKVDVTRNRRKFKCIA